MNSGDIAPPANKYYFMFHKTSKGKVVLDILL